jgi:hypothetical protein
VISTTYVDLAGWVGPTESVGLAWRRITIFFPIREIYLRLSEMCAVSFGGIS